MIAKIAKLHTMITVRNVIVIEKRLLTAFILKEWEIPDDLLREICPSILS